MLYDYVISVEIIMSKIITVLIKDKRREEILEIKPFSNLNLRYEKITKAFSILLEISEEYIEKYVEDFFSNGHIARGILSYILCSSLNNKAGHEKWFVEQGEGTSLFLSYYTGILTCNKYEFYTIEENYTEVAEEGIKGYFFADIASIMTNLKKYVRCRNLNRNLKFKQDDVFFYYERLKQ